MNKIKIIEVDRLEIQAISHLLESSQDEGFRHIDRLVNEYKSGVNTFSQEGEVLFVAVDCAEWIGICGLNQETSINKKIGRIRRLYVEPQYRNKGIGKELIKAIINHGRPYFKRLVLKTDNEKAYTFYKGLGFKETDGIENQSHYIDL